MAVPGEDIPRNQSQAIVFNIQRFSIHDGPGIRTTVFLKGCPLRCAWCANPESQEMFPQLMVRDIKCVACGKCVQACPHQAISLTREQGRQINWDSCKQCLKCVDECIYEALGASGKYLGVDEIVQEVEKDRIFYDKSGGGVTLSGGEPLAQHEAALRLLQIFKGHGLHTTLDTCGYSPPAVFEKVIPFIDLILFDIKQLDPQKHKKYTGGDNDLILSNARLVSKKVKTWFRIPLVKDFNDSPQEIEEIARLAKEWGIEKISLLPYHEGGQSKCRQIGRTYPLPGAKSPDEEHIQRLREIVSEIGIAISIGN